MLNLDCEQARARSLAEHHYAMADHFSRYDAPRSRKYRLQAEAWEQYALLVPTLLLPLS